MGIAASASDRATRLRQAMAARGVAKLCVLAAILGVTESAISRWRQGGAITLENAALLCDSLEISLDWLVLGRGDMEAHTHLVESARSAPYARLPRHLRVSLDAFLHAVIAGT